MRKSRLVLCALGLALLLVLLAQARQVLPMDTRPLVSEKYAGWSGVLRLWIFEGWESGTGSLSAWLNSCIAGFEKRHPGVYVQPQRVDAEAIATMRDSRILPPDMILFSTGLLSSPEGLTPLKVPDQLRPELSRCGAWDDSICAVPVAMGGYLWAWNAALIDRIPDTWRGSDAALAVLPPEDWRRWDGALLALCSKRYSETPSEEAMDDDATPGVDLGLAQPDPPTPTELPTPIPSAVLSCRLPEDFQYDENALRRFINGEIAAMPVTQREVHRLQTLADQGRGPDWRLSRGGGAFTDQLACLAVVDKPEDEDRRSLCLKFLAWLLEDECQESLSRSGAFSVTDAPSGYASSDPLWEMETALRSEALLTPNCFDGQWKSSLEKIVRKFIEDSAEAPELWSILRAELIKNPNNCS